MKKEMLCILLSAVILLAACGGGAEVVPSEIPPVPGTESAVPIETPAPPSASAETPGDEHDAATPVQVPITMDMAAQNGQGYMLAGGLLLGIRVLGSDDALTSEVVVREVYNAEWAVFAPVPAQVDLFYVLDENTLLLTSNYGYSAYKLDVSTGSVTEIFVGIVKHVDYARREVYYHKGFMEAGLYAVGFDALDSEGALAAPGEFAAADEAEDCLYLWTRTSREEDAAIALQRLDLQTKDVTELAVLDRTNEDWPEYTEYLIRMRVGGGRIVMTYGTMQGTGHFFYGNLLSMDKDGGNQTVREMLLDDPDFQIINGMVHVTGENDDGEYGITRYSPDLQVADMFMPDCYAVGTYGGALLYAEYVEQGTGRMDLRFYDSETDSTGYIANGLLFPDFINFSHMEYFDVMRLGDFVYYDVEFIAYNEAEDSWRGHTACILSELASWDGAVTIRLEETYFDEPLDTVGYMTQSTKGFLLEGSLFELRISYRSGLSRTMLYAREAFTDRPVPLSVFPAYLSCLRSLGNGVLLVSSEWGGMAYSYDTRTGVSEACFDGAVKYIDAARGELYYQVYVPSEEAGLYAVKLDALSGAARLVSDGEFEAADEAAGCFYISRMSGAEDDAPHGLYAYDLRTGKERLLAELAQTGTAYDAYNRDRILEMRVSEDKLIFTLGTIQGSMGAFYGDLVSINKDGSGIVRCSWNREDAFEIINEMLYVSSGYFDEEYSIRRVSLDLQEWESILPSTDICGVYGDSLLCAEWVQTDANSKTEQYNLVRYDTSTGEKRLLASYPAATQFEGFSSIDISGAVRIGDSVLFTMEIFAYNPAGDTWRGHVAYSAACLAEWDGGGVTILHEVYYDKENGAN